MRLALSRFHGLGNDYLVLTEGPVLTPELVVALCDRGYQIEHLECASTGHADAAINTILDQLAWAHARAAGESLDPDNTCVVNPPIDCEDLLGR